MANRWRSPSDMWQDLMMILRGYLFLGPCQVAHQMIGDQIQTE